MVLIETVTVTHESLLTLAKNNCISRGTICKRKLTNFVDILVPITLLLSLNQCVSDMYFGDVESRHATFPLLELMNFRKCYLYILSKWMGNTNR